MDLYKGSKGSGKGFGKEFNIHLNLLEKLLNKSEEETLYLFDNLTDEIIHFLSNIEIKKLDINDVLKKEEKKIIIQQLNCAHNGSLNGLVTVFAKFFNIGNEGDRPYFKKLDRINDNILYDLIKSYPEYDTKFDSYSKELIFKNYIEDISFESLERFKNKNIKQFEEFTEHLFGLLNNKKLEKQVSIILLRIYSLYIDKPSSINSSKFKHNLLYNFHTQFYPSKVYSLDMTPLRFLFLLFSSDIDEETKIKLKQSYREGQKINIFETSQLRLEWLKEAIINFIRETDNFDDFTLYIPLFFGCGLAGGNDYEYSVIWNTLFTYYAIRKKNIKVICFYRDEQFYCEKNLNSSEYFYYVKN